MKNNTSLDTLCGALCYALGINSPKFSADANEQLKEYIDNTLSGEKCDRIFMYNPDAIAQWIYEKYPYFMQEVIDFAEVKLPLCTVMPSVTPVCFGTMYTGAQPCVHGIQKYEKPVIKIDSIFDALLRAGKKAAIVSYGNASMSNIYLERDIDYYIYQSMHKANAKATELIKEDKYDFICVYNGNFDSRMHKFGPESVEALAELRANSEMFSVFNELIKEHWKDHKTLVGFAMDHGCHQIDEGSGSHGLDMDEDLNIVHFYKIYK